MLRGEGLISPQLPPARVLSWGLLANSPGLALRPTVALSILCYFLLVLPPCYTPRHQGQVGWHLLGQDPARPSGWARPRQRCPR